MVILNCTQVLIVQKESIYTAPLHFRRELLPINKPRNKQARSWAIFLLIYLAHCHRVNYSMIVATRSEPTVRPPSRYFNPVFPYIFHIFLYILNRLIRITKYQLETPIQKTIYIPNLLLKNSYDMYMSMHLNQIMLYYMRLYQMYCNILLHHNHKTLQNH